MMFIVKASKYPIGLDISDSSIKAVQLSRSGEKITIQALSRIELPEGLLVDGDIKNADVFAKSLNTLLLKPKYGIFSSREIVASLPDSRTYIKIIRLDNSPNDVKDLIANEIENHIPVPLPELCYDFQVMSKDREHQDVLVAAAPLTMVNQYIGALGSAKLSVLAFENESIANARALLKDESQKKSQPGSAENYAIINIGARNASFVVYAKNTIVFSVSMPISGQEVTEKISKALEITADQAEKAKIICGLDRGKAQGIISDILQENISRLNERISSAIAFYGAHYGEYGPLTKVILSGGGAAIKNLAEIIQKSCGLATVIGDISTNIHRLEKIPEKVFVETHNILSKVIKNSESSSISAKQNSSLGYATAIGLALRNIYLEK